ALDRVGARGIGPRALAARGGIRDARRRALEHQTVNPSRVGERHVERRPAAERVAEPVGTVDAEPGEPRQHRPRHRPPGPRPGPRLQAARRGRRSAVPGKIDGDDAEPLAERLAMEAPAGAAAREAVQQHERRAVAGGVRVQPHVPPRSASSTHCQPRRYASTLYERAITSSTTAVRGDSSAASSAGASADASVTRVNDAPYISTT